MWTEGRRVTAVILLAGLASGCYQSTFPLDPEPLVDLNPALVATWRCLPADGSVDEPPATLTITRAARARVYDVVWEAPDEAPERYEAYASAIRGTTVMNVGDTPQPGASRKWIFMQATLLRRNVLHLQVVEDDAMAGVAKTAAGVRAALERGRDTAGLYRDVAVCARATAGR
jgi:hypothetical protein